MIDVIENHGTVVMQSKGAQWVLSATEVPGLIDKLECAIGAGGYATAAAEKSMDMRTVEPQSKYTCYEEWYADHIADLDDADKAEAADRRIEVGSQDAAMWKALYEQRGKEIERLRDELETSLMDAETVRGHMRRFMETNDKLRAELAAVSHTDHLAEAQKYGGNLVFTQDATTHALIAIAESLNSIRISLEEMTGR